MTYFTNTQLPEPTGLMIPPSQVKLGHFTNPLPLFLIPLLNKDDSKFIFAEHLLCARSLETAGLTVKIN